MSSATSEVALSSGLVWLKKLADAAIDLLFPPYCVACRRFGAWLCADCVAEVERIQPPICLRCGLPLGENAPARSVHKHCQSSNDQVDRFVAYAFYGGPLREAIRQFKYQDLRALSAPLGKLMADGWTALSPHGDDYDVIVPVPLHPTRQRQRGYNQAALLARELGARTQHPVVEDTLVRTKPTTPQVDLDAQARRANVFNAFECTNEKLSAKRLLLVDDVLTSGATMEASAAALRAGGASSIWAYTLARAKG